MIQNFSSIDGLILAGIMNSGRNVNLKNLITTIDYIDRSTPTREELNLGLLRLETCGYITFSDGLIKPTKLAKNAGKGCFTIFSDVIRAQLKFREKFSKLTYDCEKLVGKEYYSQEEYDIAVSEYSAGMDMEINRLLYHEKQAKSLRRANRKAESSADAEGEIIYVPEKRILNYTSIALEYQSEQNERITIKFSDCAKEFKDERGGNGGCVGERDFTELFFILFTHGKRTKLQFKKKKTFYNFQRALQLGDLTTFDLT